MSGPWECSVCTWVNDNAEFLACIMCQSERRVAVPCHDSRMTASSDCDRASAAAAKSSLGNGSDLLGQSRQPMAKPLGDDSFDSRQYDDGVADQSLGQPSSQGGFGTGFSDKTEAPLNGRKATDGREGGKWNAFASLESNYQSSDDEESGGDEGAADDHRSNDEGIQGPVGNNEQGNNNQWDAFKSLEENLESSEEEEFGSSSEEDDESEHSESDGEDRDGFAHLKGKRKSSMNSDVDCVDLMDSDEDESDCELEIVKMPASRSMQGKENNKTATKKKESRKRPQKQYDPYTLDGESDSSLSEVESRRPLPSPSSRVLPSWQRRRSTPLRTDNNTLKSSGSFSCMASRNDVFGGSGSGVNGFQLASRKGDDGDDENDTNTGGKRKTTRQSAKKSAASSRKAGTCTKKATAASAKSKTTKRKRSTTTRASAKTGATKKRKRGSYRRRSYKRKSTTGGSSSRASSTNSNNNNNNAWSARERGIRQPYNRRGGGRNSSGGGGQSSSAPYMAITKQEPMLRNVGGASIQF